MTRDDTRSDRARKIRVKFVASSENLAEKLTRAPGYSFRKLEHSEPQAAATASVSLGDVRDVHNRCHFGVDRTLELARTRFGHGVSRKMVKRVVTRCEKCARIDSARTFNWERGDLKVPLTWQRWAADITHVNRRPYLTVIDAASGFNIWRRLRSENASEICDNLRQLFCEFGPPEHLLTDNGRNFQEKELKKLLQRWEVTQEFSCAYRPQGNGMIERAHRTVKRTIVRAGISAKEATFWLNNTRVSGTCALLNSCLPHDRGNRRCRLVESKWNEQQNSLERTAKKTNAQEIRLQLEKECT